MSDKIINYYEKVSKPKTSIKRDKNFNNHMIEPNSMIICLGGTGAGKTNALINFLHRKDNSFYKVIIYTGSTTDEPLYNSLVENMPGVELYNNIDELPSLNDFPDSENNQEKLIVFDDFINLNNKQMKKIQEYATAGRKKGFTCFFLAQNYTQIPKNISRNAHYFIIFKLNDNITISNIFKNHIVDNKNQELVKQAYQYATNKKGDFFMIDLKDQTGKNRYRHNFLNLIKI
jgi:hypothetical protein